jgi:hypothetical protein
VWAVSAASQRGDRAEEKACKVLGTTRLGGKKKKERVPDAMPIRLSDGRLLQPEVKYRKNLPKMLTDAIEQARRYAPTSEPIAVFFSRESKKGVVVIDADAFALLVGIREPAARKQLELYLVAPGEKR